MLVCASLLLLITVSLQLGHGQIDFTFTALRTYHHVNQDQVYVYLLDTRRAIKWPPNVRHKRSYGTNIVTPTGQSITVIGSNAQINSGQQGQGTNYLKPTGQPTVPGNSSSSGGGGQSTPPPQPSTEGPPPSTGQPASGQNEESSLSIQGGQSRINIQIVKHTGQGSTAGNATSPPGGGVGGQGGRPPISPVVQIINTGQGPSSNFGAQIGTDGQTRIGQNVDGQAPSGGGQTPQTPSGGGQTSRQPNGGGHGASNQQPSGGGQTLEQYSAGGGGQTPQKSNGGGQTPLQPSGGGQTSTGQPDAQTSTAQTYPQVEQTGPQDTGQSVGGQTGGVWQQGVEVGSFAPSAGPSQFRYESDGHGPEPDFGAQVEAGGMASLWRDVSAHWDMADRGQRSS